MAVNTKLQFSNDVQISVAAGKSTHIYMEPGQIWRQPQIWRWPQICRPEVQKVVNPVILDDRKYIQNQGLAENISKT